MDPDTIVGLVWLTLIVIGMLLFAARRRGGPRPGPGTVGTVYDWLNEDKRKAVEIIVQQRAEARDPEDKDGNLPDLAGPPR